MAIFSTLTGRVGADAEMKFLEDGTGVLSVRVATDRYDGKLKAKVSDWVSISLFGKRGESVAKYITKGSTITATGTLSVRPYEGKSGSAFSIDLRANDIELVGGRPNSAGGPTNAAPTDSSDLSF